MNEQGANFNLKSKLGFESEKAILKGDDWVVTDKYHFVNAIEKLPINWISENVSEEKKGTREAEKNDFILYLANAYSNLFGEISLKTAVSALESHLGVGHPSQQKMHRTISKTSRRIYF